MIACPQCGFPNNNPLAAYRKAAISGNVRCARCSHSFDYAEEVRRQAEEERQAEAARTQHRRSIAAAVVGAVAVVAAVVAFVVTRRGKERPPPAPPVAAAPAGPTYTPAREVRRFAADPDQLAHLAFSPDGKWVLGGPYEGDFLLWDAKSWWQAARLKVGTREPVAWAGFSPDGRYAARVGPNPGDCSVRVWSVPDGKLVRQLDYNAREGQPGVAAFAPDGKTVAVGVRGETRLYDVATGRFLKGFAKHDGDVSCLAFSPDGSRLATGAADQVVRVWDVAGGRRVHTLDGHGYTIDNLAFSPDGARLLSTASNTDTAARLWDAVTGRPVRTLPTPERFVADVRFSADGKRVRWRTSDRVELRDVTTGELLQEHRLPGTGARLSPDGRFAVGSSSGISGESGRRRELVLWELPGVRD